MRGTKRRKLQVEPQAELQVQEDKCGMTSDELYLRALEIKCSYTVGAGAAYPNLRIDGGWLNGELRRAVDHYREIAWGSDPK